MKKLLLTLSALIASGSLLVSCSSAGDKTSSPPEAKAKAAAPGPETVGRIERLDPALDAIVPPGATIQRLASGFKWAEGPVWVKDGGYLLFSDVKVNTIMRFTEKDGVRPHLHPSGYTGEPGGYKGIEPGSNGLTLAPDGSLLLCQHGDRRVARLKLPFTGGQPAYETVADKSDGKRFNSPNDVVCDKAGNLYFTDPPYGMSVQGDEAAEKELKVNGVYRVAKDGGVVTLLTSELRRPNGIALSPDEKTLYVAQSDGNNPIIMAWDLSADGAISNGRIFFNAKPLRGKGPGGPDGMKVDAVGNVFATGPGGVLVITKEGKHLGTIRPSETQPTANCGFGGADGTWLYLTNDSHLCRIKLNTKGKGF